LRDESLSDLRLPIRQFLQDRHRFTYSLVPVAFPRVPQLRRKTTSPNCQGDFLRKRKSSGEDSAFRHKENSEKKTGEETFPLT